jgi:hypothetical protein
MKEKTLSRKELFNRALQIDKAPAPDAINEAQYEKLVREELDTLSLQGSSYKPNVIIHVIRWSSDPQEFSSSLERQRTGFQAEQLQMSWANCEVREVVGDGVSAFKKDTKTGKNQWLAPDSYLGALIELAKQGAYRGKGLVVFFENPDRFCRDDLDVADSALMSLLRNDVGVYFKSLSMLLRPGDQNHPIKRLILLLEFYRANRESARKSELILAELKLRLDRIMKGEKLTVGAYAPTWVGFAPLTVNGLVAEGEQRGEYIPDEGNWPTVSRIAELAFDGMPSLHAIATTLNTEGADMLRKDEGYWTAGAVSRVLRSPALKGTLVIYEPRKPGDNGDRAERLRVDNYFPAVVTPEQWDLLQSRYGAEQRQPGGARADEDILNLLPGRVICSHCRQTMFLTVTRGRFDSRAYHCRGRYHQTAEEGLQPCREWRNAYADAIEWVIFGGILAQSPAEYALQRDEGRKVKVAALQAEIAKIKRRIINTSAAAEEAPGVEELRERIKTLNGDLKTKQAELAEIMRGVAFDEGSACAWKSIREIVDVDKVTEKEVLEAKGAALKLIGQLAKQEVRKAVIGPLKALIHLVEIDASKERIQFRVRLNGADWTEWHDVTKLIAAIKRRHFTHPITEEHRAKLSAANKGRVVSEETRRRISEGKKAKFAALRAQGVEIKLSEATKAKISAALTGKPHILTEEGRRSQREAARKQIVGQKRGYHGRLIAG